ncbi:hypothetical protein ACQPU1_03090 [Clostridium paraputrificum]|uniref:hypothetical protein n=1 Tax=Clostridium TaxID=1485 RepID=UPI003D356B55
MDSKNRKEYSKENYLRNGNKSHGQYAKNSFNTTIQEPALNESGIEAKKRGF